MACAMLASEFAYTVVLIIRRPGRYLPAPGMFRRWRTVHTSLEGRKA